MIKDIYNPLSVFVAAFCAITTAVILNEQDIDWIHSVWVVMGVALLVDFDPKESARLIKLAKNILGIAAGLVVGVLSGLIVLGLDSWGAPNWSMAVIRVLFATSVPFTCAVLMGKKKISRNVDNIHFALLCAFLAPPLFATSRSQAFARVIGVLFACGVVALVTLIFWFFRPRIFKVSSLRSTLGENASLFDSTISLCITAIQASPDDKDEFARVARNVGVGQEILIGNTEFFGTTIVASTRKSCAVMEGIVSNLKPLAADAAGLYWSSVALSNNSILQVTAPQLTSATRFGGSMIDIGSRTDKYGFFCESEQAFREYFSGPIVKIENGLEVVRSDFLKLLTESDEILLSRVVHEGVGFFVVDGMKDLLSAFAKAQETVFASNAHQDGMAKYITNLTAMLISLISFLKTVIDAVGLGDEFPHLSANLIDSMRQIGSLSDKAEEAITREGTPQMAVLEDQSSETRITEVV